VGGVTRSAAPARSCKRTTMDDHGIDRHRGIPAVQPSHFFHDYFSPVHSAGGGNSGPSKSADRCGGAGSGTMPREQSRKFSVASATFERSTMAVSSRRGRERGPAGADPQTLAARWKGAKGHVVHGVTPSASSRKFDGAFIFLSPHTRSLGHAGRREETKMASAGKCPPSRRLTIWIGGRRVVVQKRRLASTARYARVWKRAS